MRVLRRLIGIAAAMLIVATAQAPGAAAAVRPGSTHGATVVKTGWWWRPNDSTPLDDTSVGVPQPSAPRVPEGSLPVSVVGGEPEKIAALEFRIDAKRGSTVDSFTLVLRENAEPGSNVNQEDAAVLACPITDTFWSHGEGARWFTRPAYDCKAAQAVGARKDGIWTFDLTTLAQAWVSETATSAPAVVLVPGADAPQSFQVIFDGVAAKGIGLNVRTTAPVNNAPSGAAADGGIAPPADDTQAASPSLSGPAAPSGIVPPVGAAASAPDPVAGSGAGSLPAPDLPDIGTAGTAGAAGPQASDSSIAPEVAAPVPQTPTQTAPVSTAAPPWYAGMHWGAYLLLPLALGLAYLCMVALGPDTQPTGAAARHGVSRALERLQRLSGRALSRGATQ